MSLKALKPISNIRRKKRKDFRKFLKRRRYGEDEKEMIEDAIDLVEQLLVYDHRRRLTAREALRHRFIA